MEGRTFISQWADKEGIVMTLVFFLISSSLYEESTLIFLFSPRLDGKLMKKSSSMTEVNGCLILLCSGVCLLRCSKEAIMANLNI